MIPAAGHVAGFAKNDPGMEYLQADRPLWRASAKIVGEHFGEATARGLGSIFR